VELHQIRYFLALARSLNFARAAEQCQVTQPALTNAVQKLEQELGGALIHGERRRTQLTDLGKLVRPMLQRAYAAAESVRTSAEALQRNEIAPLKIGLAPCVSAAVIEAPLIEIDRFMPGLEVEIVEAEPTALSALLLNGDVDAAICGDELGELPAGIDHWNLFEERFLVLMARESALAAFAAVPTDVLAKAAWLERQGAGGAGQPWRDLFPPGVEPRIGHRGRRLAHLQHIVAAGLGVMLWPQHAPHLPSLVTRAIANDPLRRNIQLLVVAERRCSPALDAFLKIARVHDWRGGFPFTDVDAATLGPIDRSGRQREDGRLATA
jgi:DNA-binding transcriptional LysR family regulator